MSCIEPNCESRVMGCTTGHVRDHHQCEADLYCRQHYLMWATGKLGGTTKPSADQQEMTAALQSLGIL